MQPFAVLQLLQSLFSPSQPQNEEGAPSPANESTAAKAATPPPSTQQNGAISESQTAKQSSANDERDAFLQFLERHERRAGRLKK